MVAVVSTEDERVGEIVAAFIEANPLPPEVVAIITREGIDPEVARQLAAALPGVVIIAHGVPARMLDESEMRRHGWVRNPECQP
jgi:ABC-type amino acid transport substrate-binding protein